MSSLNGKRIVFVGDLVRMSLDEAEHIASSLGAVVGTRITSGVDLVVAGAGSVRKIAAARERSIEVVDEDAWMRMIERRPNRREPRDGQPVVREARQRRGRQNAKESRGDEKSPPYGADSRQSLMQVLCELALADGGPGEAAMAALRRYAKEFGIDETGWGERVGAGPAAAVPTIADRWSTPAGTCKSCGAANGVGAWACGRCGCWSLEPSFITCHRCKQLCSVAEESCRNCGLSTREWRAAEALRDCADRDSLLRVIQRESADLASRAVELLSEGASIEKLPHDSGSHRLLADLDAMVDRAASPASALQAAVWVLASRGAPIEATSLTLDASAHVPDGKTAFSAGLAASTSLDCLLPLAQVVPLRELVLRGWKSLRCVKALAAFKHLQSITLTDCRSVKDLSVLSRVPELRRLELTGLTLQSDLQDVATLTQLEELILRNCDGVRLLDRLSELRSMNRFSFWPESECNIDALIAIGRMRGLTSLNIGKLSASIRDLDALSRLSGLIELYVGGECNLDNLEALRRMAGLRRLRLEGAGILKGLEALSQLEELALYRWRSSALQPLAGLQHLSILALHGVASESTVALEPLSTLACLSVVRIERCSGLTNVQPLSWLPNLQEISLEGCRNVRDVSALVRCRKLECLDLRETGVADRVRRYIDSAASAQLAIALSGSRFVNTASSVSFESDVIAEAVERLDGVNEHGLAAAGELILAEMCQEQGRWREASKYAKKVYERALGGEEYRGCASSLLAEIYEAWHREAPGSGHDKKAERWRNA